MGLYDTIGRLFPRETIRSLEASLKKAGFKLSAEFAAGSLVVLSLTLWLVLLLITAYFTNYFELVANFLKSLNIAYSLELSYLVLAFVELLASALFVYVNFAVTLMLRIDARRKEIEEHLPDFLQLAAANVRAGMPVDQALWYAARPEFGLLSQEIELAAKRAFSGVPFTKALEELAEKFESKFLDRIVRLIAQGVASGGEMGEILERSAMDMRNLKVTMKEISTSILMYVIFIVFGSVIGAPFLFAVSYKLIDILNTVWSAIPRVAVEHAGRAAFGLFAPAKPAIGSAEFFAFAVISCTIISAFASLVIGVVREGSTKDGYKYMPILIAASLAVFLIMSWIIDQWFAGIF